jgi:hypothetical protein
VLGGSGFSGVADASSDGLAYAVVAGLFCLTLAAFSASALRRALGRPAPEPAPAARPPSGR